MSTCNCTIRPPREESVGPVAIFYSVPANLLAPHSVLRNRSPVISRDRTGSNVGDEGFYRRRGRETCGGVINWCRLATFRTPRAHGMGGRGLLGWWCWWWWRSGKCQSSGVQACAIRNMRRGWKPADDPGMGPSGGLPGTLFLCREDALMFGCMNLFSPESPQLAPSHHVPSGAYQILSVTGSASSQTLHGFDTCWIFWHTSILLTTVAQ